VPADQVAAASAAYGSGDFEPYVSEVFLAFNMKSPTFADARLREAIVRSVDRNAIVKDVYQGAAKPLNGVLVSGVPGYVDNACGDRCVYDPAKARALLAAAFPTGTTAPAIPLDYDDDPAVQKLADAVKADLAAIGLTVTLRPRPAAQYADFTAGADKQLFRLGWVAGFVSPDAFLAPLFSTGSAHNLQGFTSPAVDAAITAARAEGDATARLAHYRDAEAALMQAMAVVPIAQVLVHSVSGTRVRGLQLTPAGTFDGAEVWFAPAK
jgi:oligopeptide transport system substrate-binding protein